MTDMTDAGPEQNDIRLRRASRAATGTLALVALADFLLYGHAPGLNLFAYAVAIGMGILLLSIGKLPARPVAVGLAVALLAAAPLLEAPTPLGVVLALGGLAMLTLASSRFLPDRLIGLPGVLTRYAVVMPIRLIEDLFVSRQLAPNVGGKVLRTAATWIVPIGFAAVFAWLFSSANPVIEEILRRFDLAMLLQFLDVYRLLFWLSVAAMVWALLRPRLLKRNEKPATAKVDVASSPSLIFGEAAILRSLVVFNALFAIQSGLDLTYLWGGVALPDGMTHAEYAHRGAYPLIVTALLAAGFVLLAMRPKGAAQSNRIIRGLVYAWIAQNILLVISSILRLDLYVEFYSLTEMRLAAGIWMGLVAVGLALILLRIWLKQSNTWLVAVNLAALTVVFYSYAVIDTTPLIASFNVLHSREISHKGQYLDLGYLKSLGPTAIPALDGFIAATDDIDARLARHDLAGEFQARPDDWRSWSFRDWRLQQYLDGHPAIAP
ncbi:MAG TPA: DUF4173 domain-containing protein [Devosiaceae bacterium]|jgi:hypothetical protein